MRVDHLVWFSPDLAAGDAYFTERLDRPPAHGGVHPGGATHNSLVSLGNETYIEILAPDPAQESNCLDAELQALRGHGLYHWAAGGIDLDTVVKRARRAGLDASDVVAGGRALPDGRWLGWRLAGIRNHPFGALVPFFIDWTDSSHPAANAPRGGRLAAFEIRTPEAVALNRLFTAIGVDLEASEAETVSIVATIASKSGMHELRSFEPLPLGFVI